MRVATYTRISTDEDHQPYSLEAQAERLVAYLRSQPDWELTRRFSDQAPGPRPSARATRAPWPRPGPAVVPNTNRPPGRASHTPRMRPPRFVWEMRQSG